MINLRFHIVSIVAVFLALAIGILTGSTLLDRATIEVLQDRQTSLDNRNA
ncbi:MAG: copper transporter, partial [Actinobacteria bacterium]|nr:copper transporter [Actinomycetota bacterium]